MLLLVFLLTQLLRLLQPLPVQRLRLLLVLETILHSNQNSKLYWMNHTANHHIKSVRLQNYQLFIFLINISLLGTPSTFWKITIDKVMTKIVFVFLALSLFEITKLETYSKSG